MKSDIHDIEVVFQAMTDRAIGIRKQEGAPVIWLPLAHVEVSGEMRRDGLVEVRAEESLLRYKGLI